MKLGHRRRDVQRHPHGHLGRGLRAQVIETPSERSGHDHMDLGLILSDLKLREGSPLGKLPARSRKLLSPM